MSCAVTLLASILPHDVVRLIVTYIDEHAYTTQIQRTNPLCRTAVLAGELNDMAIADVIQFRLAHNVATHLYNTSTVHARYDRTTLVGIIMICSNTYTYSQMCDVVVPFRNMLFDMLQYVENKCRPPDDLSSILEFESQICVYLSDTIVHTIKHSDGNFKTWIYRICCAYNSMLHATKLCATVPWTKYADELTPYILQQMMN